MLNTFIASVIDIRPTGEHEANDTLLVTIDASGSKQILFALPVRLATTFIRALEQMDPGNHIKVGHIDVSRSDVGMIRLAVVAKGTGHGPAGWLLVAFLPEILRVELVEFLRKVEP